MLVANGNIHSPGLVLGDVTQSKPTQLLTSNNGPNHTFIAIMARNEKGSFVALCSGMKVAIDYCPQSETVHLTTYKSNLYTS